MKFKWLHVFNWMKFDEIQKDEVIYLKNDWNEDLKDKIMKFEKECEQLCSKIQEAYKNRYMDEGIFGLIIKLNRTVDNDEYELLTEKDCFEETYESQIVIDYMGDQELKLLDKDSYQSSVFIWYKGKRKAHFCGKSLDDLEHEIKMKLDQILEFVDEER